jgi:hypothetical protein
MGKITVKTRGERLTKCISAVRLEMKLKFGFRGFIAVHVQGFWQAMSKEAKRLPI